MTIKKILIAVLFLVSLETWSQTTNLGGNASLWLGNQASFYFGGNTTLNGTVTNNGEIISYSDLDFVLNRSVGSLRFVGDGDQNLLGDTLDVTNMVVDKAGNSNVLLQTDRVVVSGMLDVTNGVVQAEDELDLLVSGSSDGNGQGFVEGKLVGLSTGQAVTFPMGVNGSPNYITLSGTTAGSVFRVEIAQPDFTDVRTDADIQAISEEVEWVITSIGNGSDGQLTVDFSGVNLNTQNIELINADVYQPAVLALVDGDSLYRVLLSAEDPALNFRAADLPPSAGTITVENLIAISEQPVRLALGWIPVVDDIEFYVPNSFAPAGNQMENQTFRPFLSGDIITTVSISVFNSLNQEVYSVSQSGDNLDLSLFGWDGTLPSGQQAQSGVFYYNIVLVSSTDRFTQSGAVLLVR